MTTSLAVVPNNQARSIQGERVHQEAARQHADRPFISNYVRTASDGVLTCRQGYKHRYPPLPRTKMRFDGLTPTGYLRRTTAPCLDCGCARQVQLYESLLDEDGELYIQEVRKYPEYLTNAYGETYLTEGHGKMRTRDIRSEIVTLAIDDEEALEWAAAGARERHKATKGKQTRRKS